MDKKAVYQRILAWLDVPKCGCPLKKVRLCQILRKCPAGDGEECECPYLPGPACEHVKKLAEQTNLMDLPLGVFHVALDALKGDKWREPPEPEPEVLLTKEHRLATYIQRHAEKKHLYSRYDRSTIDGVATKITKRSKNGRPSKEELQSMKGLSHDSDG